jgi:hypothetical protein
MSPSTWSWNKGKKMTHEKQSWNNESKVFKNEELSWKERKKETNKVKCKIGKNQLRELKGM